MNTSAVEGIVLRVLGSTTIVTVQVKAINAEAIVDAFIVDTRYYAKVVIRWKKPQ